MARIAFGGWQHETNTFATIKADYQAFERADEWPPLSQAEALVDTVSAVHLPLSGALSVLQDSPHELVPLLWCSATPSAHVTRHAFESISARFLRLLEAALPLDGIYLDLHGAMVCEHLQDGEGEFLQRIRALVGRKIPIVISLDLHANVTAQMLAETDAIEIYRTYPHIDMGETGARAARRLLQILSKPEPLYAAYEQIDFLIPLNFGCSLFEPCRSIYAGLPERIRGDVQSLSFACGFHLSDIHAVGPAVVGYAHTQRAATEAVAQLADLVRRNQSAFNARIWATQSGVAEAIRRSQNGNTVVIADTQDNPGGGGSGDTTGILQELLAQGADNAIFGALADAAVADKAHARGIGAELTIALGGKSGLAGQQPFNCRARVLNLSDGCFVATGPMYRGARMQLGNTALLEIQGVQVLVCSQPVQTADQTVFQHIGVEPSDKSIVALKSSVHFRNHFSELAAHILVVAAPGAVFADPRSLRYKNARPSLGLPQA